MHKKIVLHSIAFLLNVKKLFTGYPDELLTNSLFNAKYDKGVLAYYKLDNLNGDIDLETSQIAFAEDMEDL